MKVHSRSATGSEKYGFKKMEALGASIFYVLSQLYIFPFIMRFQ